METREEKLATWANPSVNGGQQSLKILTGSLSLNSDASSNHVRIAEDQIDFNQIEKRVLETHDDDVSQDDGVLDLWHFKVVSLPRIPPGRLALSIPKPVFKQIQDSWNLHPRTIERRSTGFDCVSITCDPSRRTTYVLYHHLSDEDSVFATLLSAPERCIDPHFFAAALYRSHCQHIEAHRNTIDETILAIERGTNFGSPGKLASPWRHPSLDEYPALEDPKKTIRQLSYCQTDLAVIGHVARCSLDCGEWLVRAIDERLRCEQLPEHRGEGSDDSDPGLKQRDRGFSKSLRAAQLVIRDEVEYTRRRAAMLSSQVEQMRERTQSQTGFMLNSITQSDSEYAAAIAVDGKSDSIAMKTISILGIVYLPATFVATLFSMNMFEWGLGTEEKESGTAAPRASPSIWIYWAVTVPLTLATFLAWILWSRRERQKTSKRFLVYRTKSSDDSGAVTVAATSTAGLVSSEKMV